MHLYTRAYDMFFYTVADSHREIADIYMYVYKYDQFLETTIDTGMEEEEEEE